jgi:hypothetical protein
MATLVAGCFFLKFWRLTRERLFLCFACAFWVFCLNWTGLALLPPGDEGRHYVYAVRLLGFLLLIAGIIDKNRRS